MVWKSLNVWAVLKWGDVHMVIWRLEKIVLQGVSPQGWPHKYIPKYGIPLLLRSKPLYDIQCMVYIIHNPLSQWHRRQYDCFLEFLNTIDPELCVQLLWDQMMLYPLHARVVISVVHEREIEGMLCWWRLVNQKQCCTELPLFLFSLRHMVELVCVCVCVTWWN